MSKKKEAKQAKKSDVKAQNSETKAKAKKKEKKEKQETPISPIKYDQMGLTPTGEKYDKAQKVKPFSELSRNKRADCEAIVASFIARYFFGNKRVDKFNAGDALNLFNKLANISLEKGFVGCYPDSPLHRGLHRISKSETKEIAFDKDNNVVDTFARGMRQFIQKMGKVGLKNPDQFYLPAPNVDYEKIDETELAQACKQLAGFIPESRKALCGVKG